MRSFNSNDNGNLKTAKTLLAQPWQLEMLAKNPSYPYWGNWEDYIESYQELVDLDLYSQIVIVEHGNCFLWKKVGYTSEKKEVVVLSSTSNVKTAKGISRHDFVSTRVFLCGEYDSAFLGEIMVGQLHKSIERVKDTYQV